MSVIEQQIQKIKRECSILTTLLDCGKIKVEYSSNKKIPDGGKIIVSQLFDRWDS